MKEISLKKKKTDQFPTKTTLNLFYKEDRTTRPATISLYVLFIIVLLLGIAKLAIYDPTMELRSLQRTLGDKEDQLAEQMSYLVRYDEVSSQYARYSYSYLLESELLRDRIEVLDMLEETVFLQASLDHLAISGNSLTIRFYGLDLSAAAALARQVEGYEFVEFVSVRQASLGSGANEDGSQLETNMVIALKAPESSAAVSEEVSG